MHSSGRRFAVVACWAVGAAIVASCATGVDTSPGGPPASSEDAAAESGEDGLAEDSGEDAQQDAAPDAPSDAAADATMDGAGDAAEEPGNDTGDDASLDATGDVTADAVVDVSDAAPEDSSEAGATADAMAEAGADVSQDAQDAEVEAGPDAPADSPTESSAEAGCAVAGCLGGTESRAGCANARVIGRKQAMGAGHAIADSTCLATNADDKVDPACWDSAPDHAYRVFMRQGETLGVTLTPVLNCSSGGWLTALKIYSGTGCTDAACATKDRCQSPIADQVTEQYTATHDAWVTIVVDGYSGYDTGTYELNVVLTCNVPGCEC